MQQIGLRTAAQAASRKPVLKRIWGALMDDFKAEFENENIAIKVKQKTFAVWIYRLVVLALIGFGITDRVNVSKLLPSADDVAEKILVSEKFQPVLEKALVNALKKADEVEEPAPAKTKGKPGVTPRKPSPRPAPIINLLREGEMITTKEFRLPALGANQMPIPPMRLPE